MTHEERFKGKEGCFRVVPQVVPDAVKEWLVVVRKINSKKKVLEMKKN